ncbi:type II toxin-antitoxin system HicA family toxin [Anabaena cylindrica FACHB-243]|uniref:YcfA family protein n=1 Tax=Anabaena cylindrica (strain ATCC 27899 / PCC 7122) TaxID=272123 RepID=K9ZL37_ANACC|nr:MULTISPECIES: type II toxin-antitoxin system HicA family toxin [Anabaena]AFZ59906.1 YcfA family protein [Anabaena cylindrica PCC 7122]MBD2416735.1 type II toxin-antitoxin system HicA family toxin [Anabaena cylindrica FACHB-243]MBY5285035.1 type II toxin-antitoxin system HicA family toxin [Anabaena sp. CCAP 1446/1C]MBY5308047.1 type II toxin-antitoxin system HicA family toxin [Anabaena sp. CCAP 1446/1C]MCM2409844.1 type II toxin-antitoxin system HicA family toxin [Anabaena sp. CCAP 1446/1C]
MKSVSGKSLCKIVERYGWTLKRITGSHHIYAKEGMSVILSIPVHSNRDLPNGTLRSILKDASLTEEDLD